MNFVEAASEIVNWAKANPGAAIALTAGFAAAAKLTYDFVKPQFARPTPTGFDDPEVKASREKNARMMRQLGIGEPK